MSNFITFKNFTESELLNILTSTLAWIGDAVYSLCAREFEMGLYKGKPNKLHKMTTKLVNANAQSLALEKIYPFLNETEQSVVRRAKNSPITTKSKHYGLADYKRATGLEALVGYLYLLDNTKRLNEILKIIFEENEQC